MNICSLHSLQSHASSTVLYPNMTTAVHWPVDDIDDALAADFDGSLSGLGIELGTSNFNMRSVSVLFITFCTLYALFAQALGFDGGGVCSSRQQVAHFDHCLDTD